MMKNTVLLITAFLISGLAAGQQITDYLLQAKALSESGRPGESVELLSGVIGKIQDARLFTGRAEAKLLGGDFSGAISDFNAANDISGFSGEYGLAKIYALKGDAPTSLYHLELHMKSPYRKSEKEILLDPSFSNIENKPEWRIFWRRDWYTVPEQKTSEVEYYVSVNKTEEAREILSELKRDYPYNNLVYYAGALIALSGKRFSEAVKTLSELLSAEPSNEKYLRVLAKAQTGLSNYAGASDTYTRLLNLGVADAQLLILRAECYRKTGENPRAIADIEKFLTFYPDNKSALSLAGKTEASSGDNLKALEYFSRNLKLHPEDPECYIDRADSYFVSKSWVWAANDYSMSLDLKPDNPDVWLSKGIATLNMGKEDDACHDFRKALSLGNKRAPEYISKYCIK
ncbi:MAG: tetratricopeptide repeat protein [Bacteroidales bacterium]|nr:tetratricopeptide repeat protein [Bacteroidales bacterium]